MHHVARSRKPTSKAQEIRKGNTLVLLHASQQWQIGRSSLHIERLFPQFQLKLFVVGIKAYCERRVPPRSLNSAFFPFLGLPLFFLSQFKIIGKKKALLL